MYLIAGLGNPGSAYEGTRHNIGFAVVRELAKKYRLEFRKKAKFKGQVAEGAIGNAAAALLLPTTFMNLSGESIAAAVQCWGIELSHLLVVVDDVAIPFGNLRLRSSGSSGGHNGLKSIEEHLQTQMVPRLRVGVGEERGEELADYVLSQFSQEEKKLLPAIVERAIQAIELWLEQGIDRAMEIANAKPSNPSKEEKP